MHTWSSAHVLVPAFFIAGCVAPIDFSPLVVTEHDNGVQEVSFPPARIAAQIPDVAPRVVAEPTSPPIPTPLAPPPTPEPPRAGTVVLHVGDSFVHAGLTQRLREHFEPLGVRYRVRAKPSTITLDWAKRLPMEVAQTQPDLVIITLGANELRSQHLDVQARAIRRMVKSIGDRPCVWTTPPLWLEETGLFDTLQTNAVPCRFFETDREIGTFLPRRDRVHTTHASGAVWADELFDYLMVERIGDEAQPWRLLPSPEDERTLRGFRKPLPRPDEHVVVHETSG